MKLSHFPDFLDIFKKKIAKLLHSCSTSPCSSNELPHFVGSVSGDHIATTLAQRIWCCSACVLCLPQGQHVFMLPGASVFFVLWIQFWVAQLHSIDDSKWKSGNNDFKAMIWSISSNLSKTLYEQPSNSEILRYVLAGHWFSENAKNEVCDGTFPSDNYPILNSIVNKLEKERNRKRKWNRKEKERGNGKEKDRERKRKEKGKEKERERERKEQDRKGRKRTGKDKKI